MSYIQSGAGGGGGSGTVTNTGGALTANAVVLGAGGNDEKVTTAFTTDGAAVLTVGVAAGGNGSLALAGNTSGTVTLTAPAVAGTRTNAATLSNSLTVSGPQVTISAAAAGNGVLALSGNTSGTSTLTASAVAGTSTNPVTSSNIIYAPLGGNTTPAFGMNGGVQGMYGVGTSLVFSANSAINAAVIGNTQFRLSSTAALNFANSDAAAGTQDIGVSRTAAGVLAVGNGTAADKTGLLQSGMTVFVTGNFTTSGVGTALEAITGLSITVPALAANWKFHAHLAYSQAVGTAAVGFGIQAVTNNPTNIFATGELFTAAGTVTTGVLATLATTTATQIVSGTPGGTGTNLVCDLYGTCELAASANTIRLLVSTATAADLVTILRGSYFSFCP